MSDSRGESQKTIGRGNLIYSEKQEAYFFIFDGNEPRTCSSCKSKLEINAFVCEICNKPYCFKCVADYKSCSCYKDMYEHKYIKATIKEAEK